MRTVNPASYKLIERPIYGSSRVGIDTRQGVASNPPLELIGYTAPTSGILTHELGLKQYEFSNHLGNVLTTVTDKKIPVDIDNNGTIDYYVADITSATDYYPFGSPMDGRTFSGDKYRFGFNGKENDNEVKGEGNSLDFGARIYDSRLGRWLSCDRLEYKHPDVSSYNYAGNSPIVIIDEDGDDIKIYYAGVNQKDGTTKFKVYSFKGDVNDKNMPKDQFVAKFIEAYKYNSGNGGGDKLKEAAANKTIEVKLFETDGENQAANTSVYWNPQQGGMTSEGAVNSPSTVLEVEVDHALDAALDIHAHYDRRSKPDAKWKNKEEKRVHGPGGSQEKTGKANREFKKGYTRKNYGGSIPVIVDGGVKSCKVNKQKTLKYLKNREDELGGEYGAKQKQTINNYIKK